MYIDDPTCRRIGDGFVPKTLAWRNDVEWADVVVFDDTIEHGALAEELRHKGHRVVGGTSYTDALEGNRGFGQAEMRRLGIQTLDNFTFSSIKQAHSFVRENPGAYVIKPNGIAQNIKRLLYVGERSDGSDVLRVLEGYAERWNDVVGEVVLQQTVLGVEVGVGAFFNGHRFIMPATIAMEHKRLCAGEVGPMTGEMGTIMFWSHRNAMVERLLAPFEPVLREQGFVGYFDINCIANEAGLWPLEITPRFGYPTIALQMEGIEMPIGELLLAMASGSDIEIPVKKGYQIAIRLRLPPFPYRDPATLALFGSEIPISFRTERREGYHIEDARCENGAWFATGSDACPLVVTASGSTIKEAQALGYSRVRDVHMPNMFFRNDIGDRWIAEEPLVRSWGMLDLI